MKRELIESIGLGGFKEMSHLLLGDCVGEGSSRTVMDLTLDPSVVVKIEQRSDTFQNVSEWRIWSDFKYAKDVSKWLAPCYGISHNGNFLLMAKTEPLPKNRIPKKLPRFLTDLKPENFGLLNNKVVCHDYGYVIMTLEDSLRNWK